MATCKDCIHYDVCAKEGRMVQIDDHTWDDYNQLDNVDRFCGNYMTEDVVPRSEVAKKLLLDLKAAVTNKATYPDCKAEYAYINLKVFNALVQEFIKKYEEGEDES